MSIIGEYRKLDTNSRLYLIFISFFWLIDYFAAFWRRVGVDPYIANSTLLFVLAIISHGKWRHLIRISDIAFCFLFACFYFISIFIYPISKDLVMSNALIVLFSVVPYFFIGIVFKPEEYKYWLMLLSRLSIVINIAFSFILSSNTEVDTESMHKAYVLLPSVLCVLWQLFERFKLIDLLFFAVGFFMLCSMGSRGPFVCVLFFSVVYLFFFKEWKHKTVARVVVVAFGLFLYTFSTYIAEFMILLLSVFGKSTRIFDKMLNESLMNYEQSSGRNRIHEELFQYLSMDDRGFGYGLFSDRIYTGSFYAHNLFVEVWFSFGYLIGSVLLGMILILYIRFFLKARDNYTKVFGLIFFTASFVKLMFSGSFIIDGFLFFLIGYCLNGLRASKLKN